jgi:hypothetical protein
MLDMVVIATVEARMFLGSCWNIEAGEIEEGALNIGMEAAALAAELKETELGAFGCLGVVCGELLMVVSPLDEIGCLLSNVSFGALAASMLAFFLLLAEL